jgi:hypothetical protein
MAPLRLLLVDGRALLFGQFFVQKVADDGSNCDDAAEDGYLLESWLDNCSYYVGSDEELKPKQQRRTKVLAEPDPRARQVLPTEVGKLEFDRIQGGRHDAPEDYTDTDESDSTRNTFDQVGGAHVPSLRSPRSLDQSVTKPFQSQENRYDKRDYKHDGAPRAKMQQLLKRRVREWPA